jgi:hypothetical protein
MAPAHSKTVLIGNHETTLCSFLSEVMSFNFWEDVANGWFWTLMAFSMLASLYLYGGSLLVAMHTMALYTCTVVLSSSTMSGACMVFASPAARPTVAVFAAVLLLVGLETAIVAVGLHYGPNAWPTLLVPAAASTIFMISTPSSSSRTDNEELASTEHCLPDQAEGSLNL